MEDGVLSVIADKKVIVAIVVVVADAAALTPSAACEACFCGYVSECAVTIVFEEVAGGFLSFGEAFETPAVDEEDVELAILIVVVESDAAAGGFKQIFVFSFAAIKSFCVDAGLRGYVDELQA